MFGGQVNDRKDGEMTRLLDGLPPIQHPSQSSREDNHVRL